AAAATTFAELCRPRPHCGRPGYRRGRARRVEPARRSPDLDCRRGRRSVIDVDAGSAHRRTGAALGRGEEPRRAHAGHELEGGGRRPWTHSPPAAGISWSWSDIRRGRTGWTRPGPTLTIWSTRSHQACSPICGPWCSTPAARLVNLPGPRYCTSRMFVLTSRI